MSYVDELADRFRGRAWCDDPFLGPVLPGAFATGSPVWPHDPRWSDVALVRSTSDGARTVDELHYAPHDGTDAKAVPVAIVWDDTGADAVARLYYNKTLVGGDGADRVRPPVLRPEPDLTLHPTMAAYVTALFGADEQGLLAVLAPDFRVRLPDGAFLEGPQVRTGFAARFARLGGVPLQYVTATDDGTRAALEFISWRVPPHAGLGVYVRSDADLIREFCPYEGPVPLKPGQSWGGR